MTTTEQSHQIMAALATNTDWSKVKFDQAGLQKNIIRDPIRAGQAFVAFLNNGGRVMFEEPKILRINPVAAFHPTEFIGKGWTVWKGPADGDGLSGEEELDTHSSSLNEVDFSRVLFESCLKEGEPSIKGEEKLRRLKATGNIQFGGNVFLSLWFDYIANRENSCLEWLRRNRNITYLDFFGFVLRGPDGGRYVLCLYWLDSGWSWNADWLGFDWFE
jgi:hypothetical protein